MRSKLETLADLRNLDVSFSQLTSAFQVPKNWVLLERTLLLLLGLCTELDPSWNPMTVIRPYLEDVVLGQDRDWGKLLRGAVKDMVRSAITIPDDLQRVLARTNRGELEVRVPDISAAASLLYAAAHQLIYTILGTAAAVIAYQAYERGSATLASSLAVAAVVAFAALAASMRAARRGRR
jgi:predicted unusual protein kinase regulating ubiquinone biosynthesis (AarF/ABC1/UbiB family)